MKVLWPVVCGSMLSYGIAAAGENGWQPATGQPNPAPPSLGVSLGRPTPLADAVTLSRPISDAGVTQTSFTPDTDSGSRPTFRLQSADPSPRMVPQAATWSRMPSAPTSGSTGFASGAAPTTTGSNQFAVSDPVLSQPAGSPLTVFGGGASACGDPCCCDSACCDDPCACCCPEAKCCRCPTDGTRWYASGEYLLWFIRGTTPPPLVTTSPAGTPESQAGILGTPGVTTLYGGNTITNGPLSGARFRLGYWFDDCQTCGLEGSFFFLGPRSTHFLAGSNAFPILGRPFFDQNDNRENSEQTAFPGLSTGAVAVTTKTSLWGTQLNYRQNLCCNCAWRFDGLAGIRYLNLSESLNITEQGTLGPNVGTIKSPFPPNTTFVVGDSFRTQNQFFGGQVGFICEYRWNQWVLDLRTTLAIGNNHQTVQIQGGQIVTPPGGMPQVFQGGLLALPSNIGLFSRNQFSFVPEVGFNLGYQVTDNLKLFVGYNFLFWTNVLRPADQIDRTLNINQIPNFSRGPAVTPLRPVVPFNSTNIWVQGVTLGLQYRF